MAKEMIVSVNGREKKIAILEDGKVTEFYIERGEENSGVVGNIYKGRVMRVLPGMQSAFVDIGLERDAFLYVSDFFDEEEEFERIVMEKTQKADVATAEKVASERLKQARLEREQAMEAAQERAEPILTSTKTAKTATKDIEEEIPAVEPEELPDEIFIEDLTEIEDLIPALEDDVVATGDEADMQFFATSVGEVPPIAPTIEFENEDLLTPFVNGESSFERIIDDEENQAADEGELFKEARIQERIADQVRAIEFEIEPTASLEVGSFVILPAGGGLERIADDDEQTAAPVETPAQDAETKTNKRGGRGKRGGKKQAATDSETPKVADSLEVAPAAETITTSEEAEKPADGRRGKKGGNKQNAAKGEETGNQSPRGGRRRRNRNNSEVEMRTDNPNQQPDNAPENQPNETSDNESVEGVNTERDDTDTETVAMQFGEDPGVSSPADAMTTDYEDTSASVDDLGMTRSEMAVRRGGRRRRGGQQQRGGNRGEQNGSAGEEQVEAGETEDAPEATAEAEEKQAAPASNARHGGNGRGGQQREQRADRSERGERGDRGGRRAPTITDLLREGQEIMVQIAKEPIAKKGARITSHIALPGRFLVYMPTIDHAGVSRKIESGSERTRLRTLIQKIRQEEEVPSGGFIVRTAGIGISEQDLRDDARYLVRTWLDIRKGAEKSKSPALVHQDLDLVERILRDQLSDDFTAIRVDDEAEYLRVVEFINRIQPRMTNRVKLYTRDEPIMETYGVQEEIDKAVKPRVWLKSGGYLVINQTEALVSIDVNTGKFVGKGATRLEDTITKTNMEAVEEIARQIRLRDLGGIIVLDLIDMEDKRNRQRVLQTLQESLQGDKSPTKVLSFNDFGLIVMTRKRVKQSLERTLCAPCHYCQGAGLIKSAQTVCYEILEESRRLSKGMDDGIKQTTLRVHPEIAKALRGTERDVLTEIEDYLGAVDVTSDAAVHQEQFDFAFI